MQQDQVNILIWAVAFLMLLVATFIAAVVPFFLQDKAKRIAIDVLLGLATTTALFAFSESLVAPSSHLDPTANAGYVSMADVAGISLNYHPSKNTSGFVSAICSFGGENAEEGGDSSLKDAEKYVKKLIAKAPLNFNLVARLSIIEHARAKDTKDVFHEFNDSRTEFRNKIPSFKPYQAKQAKELRDALKLTPKQQDFLDTLERCQAGEKFSGIALSNAAELFQDSLPSGWYRTAALLSIYAKNSSEYKTLLDQEENKSHDIASRIFAYQLARVILTLLGFFSIWCLLATKPKLAPSLEIPKPTWGFRSVYGTILCVFYAQMACGIVCAICSPASGGERNHFLIVLDCLTVAAGMLAALAAMNLFAFRPHGTSLLEGLKAKIPPGQNLLSMLWTALLAFSAIVTVNGIIQEMYKLLAGGTPSSANPVQSHIFDSILSKNITSIGIAFFVASVLAPVAEEPVFRGLLFRWLKCRFNFGVAALLSAAMFALFHVDLACFFQYFAIGLILALVYNRTGSLVSSIFTHAMWNGWVMFTAVLFLS